MERFELTAPARLFFESENCMNPPINLATKDISSAGTYLLCTQPPVVGTRVSIVLLIAMDKQLRVVDEKAKAKIKVRGRVIRVDDDGIAIRFESKYRITALDNGDRDFEVL